MMKRKRYLYLAMVFMISMVLLMVTFAAAGAQNGSKAVEAAERAPIEHKPADINILLDKTVALDIDCAGDDSMIVDPGTAVYYCYKATNTGTITFTAHDLVDSELGQLATGYSYTLGPGSDFSLATGPITISQTTVNTATWTAYNEDDGPTDVISSTDSATVFVNEPAPLVCNGSTVGFDLGIPIDWTVINNVITSTVEWASVADCGESGNFTGGSGEAACASSDIQAGAMYDTELWSPPIDLSSTSQITLTYLANYQNSANVDFLDLDISTTGGTTWTNLLSWNENHGTFRGTPGEAVTIDLSDYAFEDEAILRWHYYDPGTATSTDWYAQIDDVALGCFSGPAIEFEKTVGLDPSVCAVDDAIEVFAGTDVYYCYAVQNTGTVTLTRHDLVDSEIGTILNNEQIDLGLGAGVWLTASASIVETTVNTATWTAFNPGNNDVVSVSDAATVNVVFRPEIEVDPTSMFSQQVPDVQVTLPLTISNVGDADLDWELFEESPAPIDASRLSGVGCTPSDIPWLSVDPITGTIAPGGDQVVDVTFDSTGMAVDTYTATLCIDSNDYYGTLISVPVTLEIPEIAIEFEKTVGLDSSVCAVDSTIDVFAGTEVFYCYAVQNTGTVTLTSHDLVDSEIGTILNNFELDLGLGAGIWLTASASIDETTVNTATWTASNPLFAYEVSASDTSTVNVVFRPEIEVDPTSMFSQQSPDVQVTLPLTVSNVGDADLDWELFEESPAPAVPSRPSKADCTPSDVPWLSTDPITGTIAPGGDQVVDVTFDSTGMAIGTYTATLCIESNDYYGTLVQVPVTLEIPEIAIDLVKTVGLDSASCAATDSISVPAGGVVVYYCYEVTNNGVFTLSTHSLVDSELGTLFTDVNYDLGPGQSIDTVTIGETFSATISATTVNTATWTAVEPDGRPTEDTATATVTIAPPTGVALSTFGEMKPVGMTPIWMSLLVLVLLVGATLTWRRKTSQ